MAIIYSYPLNQPKRDDLLIGTITYDEDAVNPVHGNPTVSFTVGSLLDLVAGQGNAQNLQQVTNIGNTTTNSIVISNNLLVSGGYYDSSNQPGTAGQLLSSTATGTQWVNVAAQGVTSVAQSHEGDAFSVTGSPITSTGTLAIEMEGSALQYINGLGNLVLLSTLPQGAVTSLTTTGTSGASTLTSGVLNIPNYDNTQNTLTTIGTSGVATLVGEVLNIPNYTYTYTLPVATDTELGGVKIGYTTDATARNYAVTLDAEQMLVNVPWTDTPYSLPLAADGVRGGVQIGYTQTATRDYPVTLDNEKMLVTVPWENTQNDFQTITGAGSDNTDSGIILSDSGGTVLILGDGTVITAAQAGNTITLTGTDTGITGVTLAIADSAGAPLVESIANRELTLTSAKYIGGANVGYVPEGGTGTTYLKGDGTWEAIPTGLIFKGTWDARNTAEGGASDGGDPDLDGIAGAADGWLYIVSTAGSAVPNGAATTPNSWNLGDWCVYDGTNWTRVPATNAGVTSVTTTDGDFVELTPTAATTGAVTITADLSAPGTKDSTTFLRGDNTWDVPVTGVTSITGQEPITIVTTGGPTATTPRIDLRYADSSAAADDNVVTACPQDQGTILLTGSDTLLINDATEGSNPAVLNVVREFSLDRLKTFIGSGDITGVTAGVGLDGGGSSGNVTLDVEYTGVGNVILAANTPATLIDSGSIMLVNTDTGANASVNQIAISDVPLSFFSNTISGFTNNTGTLTGVTGAEPLYSVTTGGGSATVPQIKLRYNEDSAGNDDSIITAAPPFGAGTADPGDLIIISDTSTSLNETKKIALSQLGFATAAGDITAVAAGDGLTGGGTSGDVTVSVMYTGTNNVILDATASTDHESTSKMMLSYDNGDQSIPVVNEMKLEDIQLGYFDNNLGWVVLGTTSTTALAGDTTTITTAQADEITANTAKTGITTAQANAIVANTAKVGITTAQADEITANTAKVTDTGLPAVIVDDAAGNMSFGNGNVTAATVRAQIGAGTSSTVGTVTNVGTGSGLTGGAITATGTISVDYSTATDNIILGATPATTTSIPNAGKIMYDDGNNGVKYAFVSDLPFTSSTGDISGVTAGTALSGGGTSGTVTLNVRYAGTSSVIFSATDATGTDIDSNDVILYTDSAGATVNYGSVSDLNFLSNTTTTITTAQANAIVANTAKVSDTGVPAILSNGTAPSLNSGITATEVRTLIGAGTGNGNGDVTLTGTQTLTNKTLTTPVINRILPSAGLLQIDGAGSVDGGIKLMCSAGSHGQILKSQPHSASVTNTMLLPAGADSTLVAETSSTLSGVTGRGASTSTACSFTNTGAQQFGSSGLSDVFLGGQSGNYIRFHTSSNGNTYFDMNCGFVYWRQASSTRFEQNMTNGTFTASGDVVAFGSPSDERLKENIKPIESALDKAMKLQGVTFEWKKSDSILSIKKDIGFIAQDVQKVAPELVRENEDGYLSMRHQGIAPILLEAIKELKAEIEELKLNKCNCNN